MRQMRQLWRKNNVPDNTPEMRQMRQTGPRHGKQGRFWASGGQVGTVMDFPFSRARVMSKKDNFLDKGFLTRNPEFRYTFYCFGNCFIALE